MITLSVKIDNLDNLKSNFSRAPLLTLRYLGNAVEASLYEIQNQAVDRNFQFKAPRGQRTGFLQKSFAFGRYLAPNKLMGSIGPTAMYSPFVYFGTKRGIQPNPFMDRIASAAEPKVNEYFNQAVDAVVGNLAK